MDPTADMKWLSREDAMKKLGLDQPEPVATMAPPPDSMKPDTTTIDPNGEWILIHNGEKFYFQSDVDDAKVMGFDVVAPLLAMHPRLSGNAFTLVDDVQRPWTVAHHLIHCMSLVENPIIKLLAGVHDAHEAFLHDMATPFKRILPDYVKIERDVQRRFLNHHGLRWLYLQYTSKVTAIDAAALKIERSYFLPDHPEWPAIEITDEHKRQIRLIHKAKDPAFIWSEQVAELHATLIPV